MLQNPASEHLLDHCLDRVAALLIGETLNLTGGNRSKAAKILGVSRPTLHSKIDKYGIRMETAVKEERF